MQRALYEENPDEFSRERNEVMTSTLIWLSFASEETGKFLGVVITCGNNMMEAITLTHMLNINPGGQVLGGAIPESLYEFIPFELVNRLLTKSEAKLLANKLDVESCDQHPQ
jgi:hypothetical protein